MEDAGDGADKEAGELVGVMVGISVAIAVNIVAVGNTSISEVGDDGVVVGRAAAVTLSSRAWSPGISPPVPSTVQATKTDIKMRGKRVSKM